ncbi:MAG: DNA primase catalytic subunit PriS [Archaeoglobaceae archaeon]|nr:DNA primase catalytic subunit PriS [Archaeoglobaceae archaeon]MDW7989682.1 DNA primase catalytic subunit PriS [Archaeoglobaceae archaeon]
MEVKKYLIKKFRDYYKKNKIPLPRSLKNREFAFVPFESLPDFVMKRHISFNSEEEFRNYVIFETPAHVYYSSAYYEKPYEENMEKKRWIGADLVFDIDADHLPIKTNSIDRALSRAKSEVKKLLKILSLDFGVREVEVYFSGGRGYHVHVLDGDFQELRSPERRELVDYLTLNNPKIFEKENFLESNAVIRIKKFLSKKGIQEKDMKKKKILQFAIEKLRVYIDVPVTTDVKRLIRMPGSLHGKTGLKVVKVEDIDSFDPFRDAVAFGDDKIKVRILKKVKIKVDSHELNFTSGETAEVPEFLAIYLLCRGFATI